MNVRAKRRYLKDEIADEVKRTITKSGEFIAVFLKIISFMKNRGKGGRPASVRIRVVKSQVRGFLG